jgi:hypothetical protein
MRSSESHRATSFTERNTDIHAVSKRGGRGFRSIPAVEFLINCFASVINPCIRHRRSALLVDIEPGANWPKGDELGATPRKMMSALASRSIWNIRGSGMLPVKIAVFAKRDRALGHCRPRLPYAPRNHDLNPHVLRAEMTDQLLCPPGWCNTRLPIRRGYGGQRHATSRPRAR